jgi:hypothetical protein
VGLGARADFRLGYAVPVFVPSVLEAVAVLPCFVTARPGALCGVGLVFVAWLAAPIVVAAAALFVATSGSRAIKASGMAVAAAFAGSVAAAQALLAPAAPGQCRSFAEVTQRSNCLRAVAERTRDGALCRTIEFRTTRFSCLQDVAVATRQAQLCEEIRDGSAIPAYEAPASLYRDGCFQNLAYARRDHGQCGKIENPRLRASCENGVP